MRSERRSEITEEAAKLLLLIKVDNLFAMGLLDLRRLGGRLGCLIDSMQSFFESSGMPIPENLPEGISLIGQSPMPIVLYDGRAGKERRNWTLAHEMGHLTLGHRGREDLEEREADAFAAALLMPDALIALWEEENGRRMSVEEMLQNFAVSKTAAARKRRDLDAYGLPSFGRASLTLARSMKRE